MDSIMSPVSRYPCRSAVSFHARLTSSAPASSISSATSPAASPIHAISAAIWSMPSVENCAMSHPVAGEADVKKARVLLVVEGNGGTTRIS